MLIVFCLLISNLGSSFPQEKAAPGAVQVHVVITAEAQREDSELPALRQDDVKVKQGKTFLQVTQLIPARGDLCLAKTSYACKMNDLAQSSIRTFPI
jgi:hypothetical protein